MNDKAFKTWWDSTRTLNPGPARDAWVEYIGSICAELGEKLFYIEQVPVSRREEFVSVYTLLSAAGGSE